MGATLDAGEDGEDRGSNDERSGDRRIIEARGAAIHLPGGGRRRSMSAGGSAASLSRRFARRRRRRRRTDSPERPVVSADPDALSSDQEKSEERERTNSGLSSARREKGRISWNSQVYDLLCFPGQRGVGVGISI